MAMYLGSKKVAPTICITQDSGGKIKYATGQVTSDSNGIVTFPQLDFVPSKILVWNVVAIDNSDQENYITDTLYEGVMLMAIKEGDTPWISLGLATNSGGIYITNSTATFGSGISVDNGIYSYRLCKFANRDLPSLDETEIDVTNTVFNYAIYE